MPRTECNQTKFTFHPDFDIDVRSDAPKMSSDGSLLLLRQADALSRANTNVRSLGLSLHQKRKAMALCLDALDALKAAILDEPIAGVTYGRPAKPR